MSPFVLAGAFLVLAALALWRLPALHPAQLWSLPWVAATALFAIPLIPYRDPSTTTVALILGGSVAFMGTAWLAGRGGPAAAPPAPVAALRARAAGPAGVLALAVALVLLVAFLVQMTASFGLRSALVSSPDVRRTVGDGGAAVTIKFVYFALAAGMLCGVAAAGQESRGARLRWLGLAGLAAAITYFTTGRSNVVTAVLMAAMAYALALPRPLHSRHVAAGAVVLGLLAWGALLAGGEIIGKNYTNNELATIDTVFARHDWLQPAALPYLYSTAPIASFNELVTVVGPFGATHGCATATAACTGLAAVGIPVEPEPVIRGFTGEPLGWNTYTALDAPLLDGGQLLVVPILALLGLLAGVTWRWSVARSPAAIVTYAAVATATLFSTIQNNFLAFHFIGAVIICLVAVPLADRLGRACAPRLNMLRSKLATKVLLAIAAVGLAAGLAACGSGEDASRDVAQRSIVEEAPPLKEVLITDADLAREPSASVRRAFFDFWRSLQHQAFGDAMESYDPRLVEIVGPDRLVEALKAQSPYFRSVRPRIASVTVKGPRSTIRYLVKDLAGRTTPRSITWERRPAGWTIYYDPFLDTALRDSVQTTTQIDIDPRARTIDKRAVQAGYRASRLQSRYLRERREEEARQRAASGAQR